ncbi:MAG: hypothetical protein Q9199_006248 [Rusavskia elegans]
MGRELQKKKNKSSLNKVKHKPKSKKLNLTANPIVAKNWNKKETLTQNYRRLGLISKLNPRAGGTEERRAQRFAGDYECAFYDLGAREGEDCEG